jgi:hypothetical protein
MNPLLEKSYLAGGAVNRYRIAAIGADDDHAVQASAVTSAMFGVFDWPSLTAAVAEDRVDVIVAGIAEVEAGGAITRGDPVTSDASGQAVAAAPALGVNNRIVGTALASAVAGDVIPVLITPSQIQGA